jgi:hypothetical protein
MKLLILLVLAAVIIGLVLYAARSASAPWDDWDDDGKGD